MTSVHAAPAWRAAIAVAWPWVPDEYAMTPRAISSGVSEKTMFAAPRILNAPPVCRFSHLKTAEVPDSESKVRDVRTGVRRAIGAMRAAASSMLGRVGARDIEVMLPYCHILVPIK